MAPKKATDQKGTNCSQSGGNGSSAKDVLVALPPSLTARQRALVHEVAGAAGLQHASEGEGAGRRIVVGVPGGKKVSIDGPSALTDADLCALLLEHLGLDASGHLPSTSASSSAGASSKAKAAAGLRSHLNLNAPGSKAPPASVEEFVELSQQLVEMERQAEVAQAEEMTSLCSPETAQARGRALLNLRVDDQEGGLLGRTLLTLVPNKGYGSGAPPQELPPHKFGPHDVVALRPSKGASDGPPLVSGVVYRVRDNAIVVAVDEAPEEGLDQPLRLEKLANEVTYQRLRGTLDALGRAASGGATTPDGRPLPGGALVDVLFGRREPRFQPSSTPLSPRNASLDESQRAAVSLALAAQDVALVHGPPGTGKTTAVVEIILQEVTRGSRVLAASASNIAVDNLVERLVRADPKMRVVRMGHPARLLPQVLDSSLEAHVLRSDNSALARDCRKEIKDLNHKLLRLAPRERSERRAIRADLRRLAKEERARQEAAVREVLKGAQVVCATLTGVSQRQLERELFDVAVVDEAAQALEAATWAALLRARRCVLAGDHLQLPPTIISEEAARLGLGRTLFERLHSMCGASAAAMLTVQYRMNAAIMDWASQELYEGKLTAHDSVAGHTLADVAAAAPAAGSSKTAAGPGSKSKKVAAAAGKAGGAAAAAAAAEAPAADGSASSVPVLLLVDTAGCGFEERQEAEGDSRSNEGEAKAVMAHVQRLLKAGIPAKDIGIITPYNAQVALLKEMRPDKLGHALEISSVDGFQGREKEAIIISMVRSNEGKQVGFLADCRRMNVAVTRARRHCALVCDSETVSSDPFLGRLVAYFEAHGDYASVAELLPDAS